MLTTIKYVATLTYLQCNYTYVYTNLDGSIFTKFLQNQDGTKNRNYKDKTLTFLQRTVHTYIHTVHTVHTYTRMHEHTLLCI